jgi:dipeptide/tripeptide permease
MPAFSDITIMLTACAVLPGIAAFLGLFRRDDSRIRVRAIGALTFGLFIGFSIVWAVLATYLRHRFDGDSILQVPYLGVQAGLVIISVFCGLVFSERSAQTALPPNVTVLDEGWVTSPRRAFRAGVKIAVLAPTGIGALVFAFWGLSTLFK